LSGSVKWANQWIWVSGGDGIFSPSVNILNPYYMCGLQDTANGTVNITLYTQKTGVCPQASDNIVLIPEPTPQVRLGPHIVMCEPAIVNFSSIVFKPSASANLRYSWYFGNGDSLVNSTNGNPKGIKYPVSKEGWYDVRLVVQNEWGTAPGEKCSVTLDSIDYVRVLPQPYADFYRDPNHNITLDNPEIRFYNKTTMPWGQAKYLWSFNYTNDSDDTSTKKNPIHTYPADTGFYLINLYAEYRYSKSSDPLMESDTDVFCAASVLSFVSIGPPLPDHLKVCTLLQSDQIRLVLPFAGTLKVFDVIGRIIETRAIMAVRPQNFDTSFWPDGIYIFELDNGKDRQAVKFVKY
jgi:PKD repeat protein